LGAFSPNFFRIFPIFLHIPFFYCTFALISA
jgi:hypothetical protein